jgi:hypothetical protein
MKISQCLIDPQWLTVAGLVLDIVGAILIASPVIWAGREARRNPGVFDTMKEPLKVIVESFYAKLGLAALLIGFLLQIWGGWPR